MQITEVYTKWKTEENIGLSNFKRHMEVALGWDKNSQAIKLFGQIWSELMEDWRFENRTDCLSSSKLIIPNVFLGSVANLQSGIRWKIKMDGSFDDGDFGAYSGMP